MSQLATQVQPNLPLFRASLDQPAIAAEHGGQWTLRARAAVVPLRADGGC